MGNDLKGQNQDKGPNTNKQFLSRIQKVSSSYSDQFGNYSIYQLQQKPYSYYLEYIETSTPQSELMQQKLMFYSKMPRNKNLVPVDYAQIIKRKELCAEFDGLRVFCMYYNFTLEDAIKLKIKQKISFTQAEIIYILKSLLSIGKFYQSELKASQYSGIYQSKKIYISPQGHVKIYPFNDHLFSAYSDMLVREEESFQSQYIDSKKVSIEVNSAKHIAESRNDMAFSKHLTTQNNAKSQIHVKKSKLTTTLKKDYGLSSASSKHSFVHEAQLFQGLNKPKESYHHEENSQSLSFLSQIKNEPSQATNKRDLFELGLLMMQLILLNESQNYYNLSIKSNQTISTSSMVGTHSRMQTSRDRAVTSQINTKSGLANLKHIEYYENDSGKIPNIDLIHFSLTKLLPKKNISKLLLNLIEAIMFPQQNTKFTIDELYTHIQRLQELSNQTKYCIKFDTIKQQEPQNNEINVSKYMVKNRSTDPFMKTADLSHAFAGLESSQQSKILPKYALDPSVSKESFFTNNTQKLDELLNQKNLASSMIAQDIEYCPDSSQILNSLKKSRKLVPLKLRSISSKGPENSPQVEQPLSTQRYRINFG